MKEQFAFPAYSTNDGMTLRDYFAAKAMQGIIASPNLNTFEDAIACEAAYQIADAMMEARNVAQ